MSTAFYKTSDAAVLAAIKTYVLAPVAGLLRVLL